MLQAILERCAAGSGASGRHSRKEHFIFIVGRYLPKPFYATLPDAVFESWVCHWVPRYRRDHARSLSHRRLVFQECR
jgi:hypothetical protein